MRSTIIILAVAVAAGGIILNLGDSRPALGADYKLEMPDEAIGFSGTLSAQVVKPVSNGWFTVKIVKVISFTRKNTARLNPAALTAVWKGKYAAVRGVKNMPELAVGDMVTIAAAQYEMHLRSTRVVKPDKSKLAAKSPGTKDLPPTRAESTSLGQSQRQRVVGIVTAKTDKDITIKADGEDEAKRYLLAPQGGAPKADLQAALKTVFVPNLVAFARQGQDQPIITSMRVILPPVRTSAATGTVVARESKPKEVAWVEIKPSDRGPAQRFWPPFGPGGMDKEMTRSIGELDVGDKVKVTWYYDERLRATKIQVIAKAKPKRTENKTEDAPSP